MKKRGNNDEWAINIAKQGDAQKIYEQLNISANHDVIKFDVSERFMNSVSKVDFDDGRQWDDSVVIKQFEKMYNEKNNIFETLKKSFPNLLKNIKFGFGYKRKALPEAKYNEQIKDNFDNGDIKEKQEDYNPWKVTNLNAVPAKKMEKEKNNSKKNEKEQDDIEFF